MNDIAFESLSEKSEESKGSGSKAIFYELVLQYKDDPEEDPEITKRRKETLEILNKSGLVTKELSNEDLMYVLVGSPMSLLKERAEYIGLFVNVKVHTFFQLTLSPNHNFSEFPMNRIMKKMSAHMNRIFRHLKDNG